MGLVAQCDHCHHRVRIRDDWVGRRLHCDQCGGEYVFIAPDSRQQPIQPPVPHQAAPYHAWSTPVEDTNSIAIVGFVMSLLGVCAAFMTAPIALGCSVAGLRKEQSKGYAIAGTIISSVQLVLIGMVFLQYLLIGRFFWQAGDKIIEIVDEVQQQTMERVATAQTDKAIDRAVEKIDDQALAFGELPSSEEGTELVAFQKDGWKSPLRYQTAQGRVANYMIKSAGPDGEWDTNDDVGRSVPTPLITDVNAAIVLLKEKDPRRQRFGVDWLLSSPPDDQARGRVVAALKLLTHDRDVGAAATRALAIWANPDDFRELVHSTAIEVDDMTTPIIPGEQPVSAENLLALINVGDYTVRKKAREAVEESSIDVKAIRQQCIRDLSNDASKYNALDYLQELPLDAESNPELKQHIFALLRHGDAAGNITRKALGIVDRIGITDDDIPKLVKVYPSCPHQVVFDLLIEHVDDEMIADLLSVMDQAGASAGRAGTFFERIGPSAESYLWKLIRDGSTSGQSNAADVLAKIGTDESIPHLQPLLQSSSTQRKAQAAIDAIQTRHTSE